MKVICVDDEKIALQGLLEDLEEIPEITERTGFNHPMEALEFLKNDETGSDIDLAFLDINMPGITGIEFAKKIKEIRPNIKVIFVTGCTEYAAEAFQVRASGYLLKPVGKEEIQAELDYVFGTPQAASAGNKIRVQCFGNFEIFHNDKPIKFNHSKTKELVAYLVDRKGAAASVAEICAVLWEDKDDSPSMKSYLRTLASDLKKSLADVGCDDLLIKAWNSYAIDINAISCDLYDFEKGDVAAINSYHGEYMNQYSWGEMRIGTLERQMERM